MTIPDLYGQITEKDVPGAEPGLLRVLNRLQSSIQNGLAGDLTLTRNVKCDIVNGVFTHGVATQVKLTKVKTPGGVTVLSADSHYPLSAAVQASGSGGASVSVLFADPRAKNVKATIQITPEGTASNAAPSLSTLIRAQYFMSVNQTFPDSAFTVINYNVKSYDPLNLVTTGANWVFTCPVAGIYHMTASINFTTTPQPIPNDGPIIMAYINGAEGAFGGCGGTGTGRVTGIVSSDVFAPVGTHIAAAFFHQSGATWTNEGLAFRNMISIHLVGAV